MNAAVQCCVCMRFFIRHAVSLSLQSLFFSPCSVYFRLCICTFYFTHHSPLLFSSLLSSKVPNTPLPCTSLQVFSSAHGDYFRALAGAKSVSKQIEYMKEFGSAAPVLGDINTVMHLQVDTNMGTTATAQVDVNVGIDVAVQAPSNSLQHTVGSAVNRYPSPTIVLSSRSCVNQPPDPILSDPIQ